MSKIKLIQSLCALTFLSSFVIKAEQLSLDTQPIAKIEAQVPGFYRINVGKFEVTALLDGFTNIPLKYLQGIKNNDAKKLLDLNFVEHNEIAVPSSINTFVINTGTQLILVDTGGGVCMPNAGQTTKNLIASGYKPENISAIFLTHLHRDHFCGLSTNDKVNYPNATVYLSKDEADYWLKSDLSKINAEKKPRFEAAIKAIAPYQKADKLVIFKNGFMSKLTNGEIQGILTKGHTPGHTSYLFTSDNKSILISGDIFHSYAIQFSKPYVTLEFDFDNKQAALTRNKLLKSSYDNKILFAGTHLPFPGIGHVGKQNKNYRWIPVNFTPN